jgi:ankyrin repeat protein
MLMLQEKGADVNAASTEGDTALIRAAQGGHTQTVKTLLERGADVSAVNSQGKTALEVAKERGRTEIVQLLKAADRSTDKDK